MHCFARLVRAVLGHDAISEGKLWHGNPCVVLGIQIRFTEEGAWCAPDEEKAVKWAEDIRSALDTMTLKAHVATKLAGRLNFAAQTMWHRLGRAMMRPIYAHMRTTSGRVGQRLATSLEWWLNVLSARQHELWQWKQAARDVVELFCDARGEPGRLAAVLAVDGVIWYTDMATPGVLLSCLSPRGDNQIMAQEQMAVLLALHTFREQVSGKMVRVWIDNTGAEHALRNGTARAADHNVIVAATWKAALTFGCSLWVERVPTDENIADLPSREEYRCLEALDALYLAPGLPYDALAALMMEKWQMLCVHSSSQRGQEARLACTTQQCVGMHAPKLTCVSVWCGDLAAGHGAWPCSWPNVCTGVVTWRQAMAPGQKVDHAPHRPLESCL